MNSAVAYVDPLSNTPVAVRSGYLGRPSPSTGQKYWVFKVMDFYSDHGHMNIWGELMPYPEYPSVAIAQQFLKRSHNEDPNLRYVCMGGPVGYSEAMQLIHTHIGG